MLTASNELKEVQHKQKSLTVLPVHHGCICTGWMDGVNPIRIKFQHYKVNVVGK